MSYLERLRVTMKYPSQEDCHCNNRDFNCAPSECRFTLCLILLLLNYSHLLRSCGISNRWVSEYGALWGDCARQKPKYWGENSVTLPLCLAKVLHELAWEHIFVLRGWQLTAWLMAWRTAFVKHTYLFEVHVSDTGLHLPCLCTEYIGMCWLYRMFEAALVSQSCISGKRGWGLYQANGIW